MHGPGWHVCTASHESSQRGRGPCRSASIACCRNPKPASDSWWRALPRAAQPDSASLLPRAGPRSPRQRLRRPVRASQLLLRSDCEYLELPYASHAGTGVSTVHDAIRYAFFAALFAAFNGSTVISPANPRRSLGGFFALVMTRYPPFGPGTLPSTTSRLSSFSTPSTRRFRTVTRALPMCPDIRIPLNTRDGNADDPIDPVI